MSVSLETSAWPINDTFLKQVARCFGQASDTYIAGARLQQQVALDALALLPATQTGQLLDLGCGPGWIHPKFSSYCQYFIAIDLSEGMLAKAACANLARYYLQADAQRLPLPAQSVDTVFSSLMLQWCSNPGAVLSEIARILTPGGRVVLTTLIDGTLSELKQAFATLDNKQHVNSFLPVSALRAAATDICAISWRFEVRSYPLYYPDVISLARELKMLGANQVAGRSKSLTGKGYWQHVAAAYDTHRTAQGLPASYHVLFVTGTKDVA